MSTEHDNKPRSRLSALQWPIILTIGVILCLSVVSGVFYLHVQDRERYYNDRYFRLLSSQSRALNQRIETYKEVLYSAGSTSDQSSKKAKEIRTWNLGEVQDAATGMPIDKQVLYDRANAIKCHKNYLWGPPFQIGFQLCQVADFFNVDVVPRGLLFRDHTKPSPGGEEGAKNGKRIEKGKKTNTEETKKEKTGDLKREQQEPKKRTKKIQKELDLGYDCAPNNFSSSLERVRRQWPSSFEVEPTWRATGPVFILSALTPGLMPVGNTEDKCVPILWDMTAELDARRLLDQTLMDRSFEDLLLIDKRGHVEVQASEAGIQFTQATLLFKGDKEDVMSGSESRGSSTAVDPSSGKKVNEVDFKIFIDRKGDANLLKKVPARLEATVAGKQMHVFAVPLGLSIIDEDQKGSLEFNDEGKQNYILVGLVSKDKLRNETWQLSPSVLLIILLVVLSIILALPLLKLLSMGPQDQWSLRDFAFLVGAGLIGTGLLTVALADAGAFWWSKEQVDDELTIFQESILQHAHKEIHDAVCQLGLFDEVRSKENDKNTQTNKCNLDLASGPIRQDEPSEKNSQTNKQGDPAPSSCDRTRTDLRSIKTKLNILNSPAWTFDEDLFYKTFDTIFWVDCAGYLREQWDVLGKDEAFLPLVTNLSDRGYFTTITNHRYWKHRGVDIPFLVEPIFSRMNGSNTAVVAIRSNVRYSQKSDDIVVAGLESRFISLYEPLIPPGMGFAVIDTSSGMVLFHSHIQRNLRENFFEEVDHNKKLKGLIANRSRGCESGTYGGNSHRFCVRVFQDIPWTLIVFKNMEPLRVANLQAVTVSSFLFAIYALVILAVVGAGLAIVKMRRQTIPAWLWPSSERHVAYIIGASFNLALILMGALSLLLLSPQPAFVASVIVLPVIGMLTTCILLKYGLSSQASIGQHRISYRVLLGSLLALCSVLPAAVCMTLSYEAEQILVWKAGALDLAKSFARSADLIRERYQYQRESTLITERLYGKKSVSRTNKGSVDDQPLSWCSHRFDDGKRLDVHLRLVNHTWWLTEWNICLDVRMDDDRKDKYPPSEGEDGFEELYQFLRVPYDEEFTRTHGLFSVTQQSEIQTQRVATAASEPDRDGETDRRTADDVQLYYSPNDGLRMVSYRPVYALKSLDQLESLKNTERWNVAATMRPWLRWFGVILVGAPLIVAFSIYLLRRPSAQLALLVLIGAIAAILIAMKYPGNTLLVISTMLGPLFFGWLAYMLPAVAARRVLLLDMVANEVNRNLYVQELREALASPSNKEFPDKYERQAFIQEFGVSERLCEIGKAILSDKGKKEDFVRAFRSAGFEPDPVWLFSLDEARHYYGSVWEEMEKEEKIALFHLARNGFIVGNHPSLFRLITKGWVTCSPQLQFVNESFRLFVLSKKDQMIELQRELASGIWDRLVWPLGFVMIFILAGLMYTQQELLTSATAFVGVLAGLVPVVSKIFDLFKTQKAGSTAS